MVLGSAYFSFMRPGTLLKAHCGPTNARLRCHLGLFVPGDCRLRVGEESREWREGELLVFDDSFEHEARVEGTEPRLVLIVDVWHPELDTHEKRMAALDKSQRDKYTLLRQGHVQDTTESGH